MSNNGSNHGCLIAFLGLLSFCILGPFGIAIFAIWMSSLSRDKKIKFTAITALLGLMCIGVIVVWSILMPAKFEMKNPNNAEITVTEPSIKISFECTKVDSITLNGTLLNGSDKSNLCSSGMNIPNLNAGSNTLKFEAKVNSEQGIVTKSVIVIFDKEAYDRKVDEQKVIKDKETKEMNLNAEKDFRNLYDTYYTLVEAVDYISENIQGNNYTSDFYQRLQKVDSVYRECLVGIGIGETSNYPDSIADELNQLKSLGSTHCVTMHSLIGHTLSYIETKNYSEKLEVDKWLKWALEERFEVDVLLSSMARKLNITI